MVCLLNAGRVSVGAEALDNNARWYELAEFTQHYKEFQWDKSKLKEEVVPTQISALINAKM